MVGGGKSDGLLFLTHTYLPVCVVVVVWLSLCTSLVCIHYGLVFGMWWWIGQLGAIKGQYFPVNQLLESSSEAIHSWLGEALIISCQDMIGLNGSIGFLDTDGETAAGSIWCFHPLLRVP